MIQAFAKRSDLANLPASITRVMLITNASGRPPRGWRETSGAMHAGDGMWIVPIERVQVPEENKDE